MDIPPDGTHDTVFLAEEAVIAACLLDDDAYGRICDSLSSDDFYIASNRMMFAGIARLAQNNTPVTTITLAHALGDGLDRVGGEPAIQEIAGHWFTALGVEAHAQIVKQDSERRQMLQRASRMAAAAGRGDIEVPQVAGSGGVSLGWTE